VRDIQKSGEIKMKISFLIARWEQKKYFLHYMIPGVYTSALLYLLIMKNIDVTHYI